MSARLVAYYRVSTDRQGQSGLGLEAQRTTIESWVARNNASIIASFTDIESGRRCDRPELAKALAMARSVPGAMLIVGKLDRLARDAKFLLGLLDSGARIGQRIKEAAVVRKKRGDKMGRPENFTNEHRRRAGKIGTAAMVRSAAEFRTTMRPVAEALRQKGTTNAEVAASLNAMGYATLHGRPWSLATVSALLNSDK